MWSLHAVTENVRRLAIVGVVVLIVVILLWSIIANIISYLSRPAYVPPAMGFGQLPPIPFPQNNINTKLTYTLNTVDGKADLLDPSSGQPLPVSDRINVYKIIQSTPSLNSLQNADLKVAAIGMVNPDGSAIKEQRVSETEYSWTETNGMNRVMYMDISSYNFTLTSNYLNYPSVLAANNLPTDSQAISTALNFLNTLQLDSSDFDSSLTTTTDYTISNGTLVPVTNAGQKIMAVKVNFFQQAVNNLPIDYPNPPDSTLSFIVTGGDSAPQVAQATYIHQVVDTSAQGVSDYPLKTAQQAFADLQAGNAYIVPGFDTSSGQAAIRTISLGYYIGTNPQQYLMPIYIFQGDNNFVAYVSAVSDNVLATPTPSVQP